MLSSRVRRHWCSLYRVDIYARHCERVRDEVQCVKLEQMERGLLAYVAMYCLLYRLLQQMILFA